MTLIERMAMVVPLLAVLVPLIKFAPQIYGWRVRSRIYWRYGELKFLENQLNANSGLHTRTEWLEKGASTIRTPLAFTDMLYTLRGHIDLVRDMILRRTPA